MKTKQIKLMIELASITTKILPKNSGGDALKFY
jgi:hypothetical protein